MCFQTFPLCGIIIVDRIVSGLIDKEIESSNAVNYNLIVISAMAGCYDNCSKHKC